MGEALNRATDIPGDTKIYLLNSYAEHKLPEQISKVPYAQMSAVEQYEVDDRYAKLVQAYQGAQSQAQWEKDVLAEKAKQGDALDDASGIETDLSTTANDSGQGQEQAGA